MMFLLNRVAVDVGQTGWTLDACFHSIMDNLAREGYVRVGEVGDSQ
jgi:hypothetical protein